MPKQVKEMILEQKKEVDDIEFKVSRITKSLLDKEPSHFSYKDLMRSLFGALFIGINFIFAGRLITVSLNMTLPRLLLIFATTIIILTGGIYYIGYRRVSDKGARHFGQFWFKRLIAFYMVSVFVSFALVYLFGIPHEQEIASFYDTFKVVAVMTVPTSFGAAVGDLLKQY